MTMIAHGHGPFDAAVHSSPARGSTVTTAAEARRPMIKRLCIDALAMLALGGVGTAVVALRAALYFWRYHV